MDETANLKLPYILAAQSQKHVTHNEALRALDAIVQLAVVDKDLSTPPGSPVEGARYIVGASPTGSWSGHATHVAAWQDGAWAFYVPAAGWLAWVDDESQSYLFSGGGWIPAPGGAGASLVPKGAWSSATTYSTGDLVEHEGYAFLSNIDDNLDNEPDADTPGSTGAWTYFAVVVGGGGGGGGGGEGGGSVNPVSLVGVNATADATNRLSVASPAALFSHEGAGHQLKINKNASGDTASVLFQTGFSGRAEFGLAGDDDFHVKVSPDGSSWHEAIVINRSSGAVRAAGLREVLSANRTYYVRTDGSDSNNGLANTSGGAFLTVQHAVNEVAKLDLSIYSVTIQVADGTYDETVTVSGPFTGSGNVTINGNATTPANVIIGRTGANGSGIVCQNGARIILANLRPRAGSAGNCLTCINQGALSFTNLSFPAVSNSHVYVDSYGVVTAAGGYAIAGGASWHIFIGGPGYFFGVNQTVTLSGTPAFAQQFALVSIGTLTYYGNTFSGSATGQRYLVRYNGVAQTNGATLPGNAAGSTSTGGQYA
jgi:hypothetical protein